MSNGSKTCLGFIFLIDTLSLSRKDHGLRRLSYLDIIRSLRGAFFFCGLVNVCIICLSPLQGQKLLPHGWLAEMFLEAFLVILGKPGHGFTIKAPNESCSLISTTPAKVPSISLHLANAELSLSPLGTAPESYTNPSKRIICFMDQQLIQLICTVLFQVGPPILNV